VEASGVRRGMIISNDQTKVRMGPPLKAIFNWRDGALVVIKLLVVVVIEGGPQILF